MFTLHFIPPDTKGTFQGIYILASKAFSLTHLFVSGFWQPMPHFGFSVMSNSATSRTATYQASLRFSHRVCSNSCPLSQWCHPAISSSVIPFSFLPQSFPASGSFPMSRLFASGGQSIRAPASASVLPVNIEGWFPLGLTGLMSLQSKGLSRVFSSTTVWKHQFFGAQSLLWSNSNIYTWLLKKTIALTIRTFVSKVMSLLFNMLFVIALLPRTKGLLISCLQ